MMLVVRGIRDESGVQEMVKSIAAIFLMALAYSTSGVAGVLDDYVREGLENNLALKQADFSLERSRAALREAKGLFLPSVGINARYSRAGGGRYFEFPVGDLVNPIHETLNQLIGEPRFPTDVPNVNTPLLREEEHETKIEVMQPLFQPAVYYNYRIKSNMTSAEEAAREVYRQDLVLEIKTAYYTYLKSEEMVNLVKETEELLEENLRVSRSLFENDKVTRDVVYRAQAELSQIEQQKAEAHKGRTLARAYFNFLLNRPLDSAIEVAVPEDIPPEMEASIAGLEDRALAKRYEPAGLLNGIEAAKNGVRLSRAAYLPDIVFVLDYGYEGEIYRFGEEDDFWMGSLVLQWDLFSGFQRKARIEQARAEEHMLKAKLTELEQAIRLEIREASENLGVARESYGAAVDRVESAARAFEIVSRKYGEGMAPHIEFLDARVSMTGAEVNLIVTKFDYHIRYAEYERAIGLDPRESS
jgi:outer membrane protein